MQAEILFLTSLVMGYLLGSINSAILVGKFYGVEIRAHGSGNAGMTNTFRTLGKLPGIIVMLGDVFKGVLACLLGMLLLDSLWGYGNAGLLAAGFGALLGHNWPLFFGFKGGKGVLTTFAVMLMMDWRIGMILFVIFTITVAIFRYISLGSIVAAIAFPLLSLSFASSFQTDILFTVFAALVSAIVIWKHRSNMIRIHQGQENKVQLSKK